MQWNSVISYSAYYWDHFAKNTKEKTSILDSCQMSLFNVYLVFGPNVQTVL